MRHNVPQKDCYIAEFFEELGGCTCIDFSDCESCPCIIQFGAMYDEERRLSSEYFVESNKIIHPIHECSIHCFCKQSCRTRVVQQGITHNLQIFDTPNKGLGLKTLDDIKKRSFVCEYAGEIITYLEAKQRVCNGLSCYLFTLREHSNSGNVLCTYYDANHIGNVGRFINHSCCPNLLMVPVRINNNVPHLALFAIRDIKAGEELTYDYSGLNTTINAFTSTAIEKDVSLAEKFDFRSSNNSLENTDFVILSVNDENCYISRKLIVNNDRCSDNILCKRFVKTCFSIMPKQNDVKAGYLPNNSQKICRCDANNCRGYLPHDHTLFCEN